MIARTHAEPSRTNRRHRMAESAIDRPVADRAAPVPGTAAPQDRYINRELSWLAFNERVLDEAANPAHPLFERLRFLSISDSNLDEFYMVRVAGLEELAAHDVVVASDDGLSAGQQLTAIAESSDRLVQRQQRCWSDLQERLAAEG